MAREIVYKCDMPDCAQVRTPTNHWFLASDTRYGSLLVIVPFTEELANDSYNRICLCGEACVHKFISQNLASLHQSTQPQVGKEVREVQEEHRQICYDCSVKDHCVHGVGLKDNCDHCEDIQREAAEVMRIYRREIEES